MNEELVELLSNCSYCQTKCFDEIKCLPCGYAICSSCSVSLKDTIGAVYEFKCQACEKMHEMPKKGFEPFIPIMKCLKMKLNHQNSSSDKQSIR